MTGSSMLSLMIVLIITGTGLYYSPEQWHENVKWAHTWLGFIGILWLGLIRARIHNLYLTKNKKIMLFNYTF